MSSEKSEERKKGGKGRMVRGLERTAENGRGLRKKGAGNLAE
jgi:hypothetical protein